MKKKVFALFLAMMLFLALPVTALAAPDGFVDDAYDAMYAEEISEVNAAAQTLQDDYGVGVYACLTDDLQGKMLKDFANDYIAENGLSGDGVLLVADCTTWGSVLVPFGNGDLLFDEATLSAAKKAYDDDTSFSVGLKQMISILSDRLQEASTPAPLASEPSDDANAPVSEPVSAPVSEPAANAEKTLVVDDAGLLGADEIAALTEKLQSITNTYACEASIVTVNGMGGKSAQDYADDFFDYNGYGFGADRDGLMLVLDMGSRQWYITTHGSAIQAFTDEGIQYIGKQMVPYLSDGDYAGAFGEFASQCEAFMAKAQTGSAYDSGDMPKEPFAIDSTMILFAIIPAVLIGFITVSVMKSKLKSKRARLNASEYVVPGSFHLTRNTDTFLYRTVTKTEIPRDDDDHHSSGGGSSTHSSSSGSTHGGGGGSF